VPAGAVAFLVLAAAAAGEPQGSASLRLVRGRFPVVSVLIDDRGPFDFLLDTGSTATVVSTDLAASLRASIGRTVPVATTLGMRELRRTEIGSISLAGRKSGPLSVLVSDLREIRELDSSLEGILGLDFLSHVDFLIDYRERTLEVGRAVGAVLPHRVSFRREAGRILVPVETSASSPALWLVLDTGADGLVLSRASGVAVERNSRRLVRVDSASGSAILRTGALPRLRAGSVVLDRVPVAFLEGRTRLGSASGLLPGRLFRRLFVSVRGGYVVFEPDT
jgi:predicted aspartyl protease